MKKLLLLLGGLMLGLAGVAWWVSAPAANLSGTYPTAAVEFGPMTDAVSATGVLSPVEVVPVGTELAGRVVEVAADFSQLVTEGDLLFRLDDRAAEQRLRQAEVAVELARAEVERSKALHEAAQKTVDRLRDLPENVSLKKELDAAVAQLRAARATIEVSEARVREADEARRLASLGVKMTRVHVPIIARSPGTRETPGVGSLDPAAEANGRKRKYIVMDRRIELNQQIAPPASALAFTLAGDLSQMQVVAQVAEGDVGRVRKAQRAEFTVASYADDVRFNARVTDVRLLPVNDHGAIFYKVILEVANLRDGVSGEWQLRPGMTASVEVIVRRHEDVWKVPLASLNVPVPEDGLSRAARERLQGWRALPDHDLWTPVWTVGADGMPWPVMVKVGGSDGRGEPAIRDDQFVEVLAWGPEGETPPERVITGIPVPPSGGLFSVPKIKI